jgi:hypothetical protein
MMNGVNDLWSSPWRRLQKNLASGIGSDAQGFRIAICKPVDVMAVSANSWLVRALSRKERGCWTLQ